MRQPPNHDRDPDVPPGADFPRSVVTEVVENLTYWQRKERGRCTRAGCTEAARSDANQCEKHTADEAARKRRGRRKKKRAIRLARKIWRKQKRCLGCGGQRVKKETRCAKCIIEEGRAPALVVRSDGTKKARIEAATSIDRDGRVRYRGRGVRGRQSVASLDEKDLEDAAEHMQRGRDGKTLLATAFLSLPRIQREGAEGAWLSEIELAYRFLGEVLVRHRRIDPEPDEDED